MFPSAYGLPLASGFLPGGSPLWTPASLGSSLKGWWKADAGVRARTAAQFTEANTEYLSRASEAALTCGDIDFYFGLWIYYDSFGGGPNQISIIKGTSNNQTLNYSIQTTAAGVVSFRIGDNSTTKVASWGSALSPGTWYFVEGYHDAVGDTVGVCVNRAADVTAATAGVAPYAANAQALSLSFGTATACHDGRMGNVVFFKRLPSAAERNLLYNSGAGLRYADAAAAGVSLTSLTGWWELDENSGTRADKSGNALTLTDNNTVTANDGKVDYAAADGDAVWKWISQDSNAWLPVQATQANKPLLVANVINSRAALRGDGAGDTLKVATGAISNQPLWGWMVVDDNDASTRHYFDGGAASKVSLFHDGTNLEVNAGAAVEAAHTAGAFHLVTFSVNGASSQIWVDGTSIDTGDAGAQNMDSGISLFADNAGGNSLAGDIVELGLAAGSPSAADLANLKAYIVARYGLTVA